MKLTRRNFVVGMGTIAGLSAVSGCSVIKKLWGGEKPTIADQVGDYSEAGHGLVDARNILMTMEVLGALSGSSLVKSKEYFGTASGTFIKAGDTLSGYIDNPSTLKLQTYHDYIFMVSQAIIGLKTLQDQRKETVSLKKVDLKALELVKKGDKAEISKYAKAIKPEFGPMEWVVLATVLAQIIQSLLAKSMAEEILTPEQKLAYKGQIKSIQDSVLEWK